MRMECETERSGRRSGNNAKYIYREREREGERESDGESEQEDINNRLPSIPEANGEEESAISAKSNLAIPDQVSVHDQSETPNGQEMVETQGGISENLQSGDAAIPNVGGRGCGNTRDTEMHILATGKIQHAPNGESAAEVLQAIATLDYLVLGREGDIEKPRRS